MLLISPRACNDSNCPVMSGGPQYEYLWVMKVTGRTTKMRRWRKKKKRKKKCGCLMSPRATMIV